MDNFSWSLNWQDNNLYVALYAFIYFSLLISTTLRIILKRRASGITLAWLFLIFVLPVFGMISYFILGELHLGKKREKRRQQIGTQFKDWLRDEPVNNRQSLDNASHLARSMQAFVESYTGMPMLKGNNHTLLSTTKQILIEITEEIKLSKSTCYLLFYLCKEGGLIDPLLQALMDAAQRGVKCKLLLDSVGSHDFFNSKMPQKLRNAGVEVVEALPVGAFRLLFQRQDLRMHRKLVCIDDHIAYTGSMNLVDPVYFKAKKGFGQWVDIMVRCEGPIVQLMQGLFVWDWFLETDNEILLPLSINGLFPVVGKQCSQLIPSGPEFGEASIHQVLLTAIYEAQYSIILTTPYFVPDESLLAALQVAALRGVDVKIIVPAKNDSFMVKYASRAFFDELLTAGAQIYKFYGGLLHTKSIVIDEKIALVGTVNLDRRSFWLNFEMTMLIDDERFSGELLSLQMQYLLSSKQILLVKWKKRSYFKKLLEGTLYLFSPLL